MNWLIRQYRGVRIWLAVRFGGSLNVKWLGAHGNYPEDQHDDTEAFQRAMNMVASKRGTISVPHGRYGSGTLNLPMGGRARVP